MLRQVCPELDGSRPGELRSAKFPHLQWVIGIRGLEHPECSPGRASSRPPRASPRAAWPKPNGNSRRRPDQPAIHVRHDRLAQGRHAEPPQPAAERLLCGRRPAARRRATGSAFRCRLYHCFGCVLGTMCAAVHRRRDGLSARNVRCRGHAGRRRGRALHGHLRRADDVHRRTGTSELSPAAICRRCGRASWRAALARWRS